MSRSLAIFAANLHGATPADAVSPSVVADLALDCARDGLAVAEERAAAGHVEEGLVEREALDERRVAAEDGEDLRADLGVAVVGAAGRRSRRGSGAAPRAIGIAERTPKGRASYDAAQTTPRRDGPPTMTGLPRSDGSSRCSTDA